MTILKLAPVLILLCACTSVTNSPSDMTPHLDKSKASQKTKLSAIGALILSEYKHLTILSPEIAEDGEVVPFTVAGLNLQTGETAEVFVDDCQAMTITNQGRHTIRTLSTRVKMNRSVSGNGTIKVSTNGRHATSKPIKVRTGSGACNKSLSFVSTDIRSLNNEDTFHNTHRSIRLRGKYHRGVTSIKALIKHPMETGLRAHKISGQNLDPHYITNISLMMNNEEIAAIKSTAGLSRNPYVAIKVDSDKSVDSVSMVWRDNVGKYAKRTVKLN